MNQTTIGALESNSGNATAAAGTTSTPIQTLAELGTDDDVNVGQFDLHADVANVQATVSDKTESDGGGVTDNATAEADEITDAKAHIGSGSSVTSASNLDVLASTETDDTNSYSKTTVFAVGAVYDSTAGSNKFVTTEVDLDSGSSLAAPEIAIVASQPPETGGSTYQVDADKTSASLNPFGNSQNTEGSEVITNSVTLDSNITLTGSVLHTLSVSPAGMVIAENGLVVTDGTNPLAVGQTDATGQIDVTGLTTGTASTLIVSAPGGTTSGFSSVVFDSNGTITVQNASPSDLYIGALNVVGAGGTPTVADMATNANWTYSIATSLGGGSVQIANTNTTGGNIHVTGAITNPSGATAITSAGGSVLAATASDSIESATFDLEADQGTLGTSQLPLPLIPLFTPSMLTSLLEAIGSAGVFLAITPISEASGAINLPVSGVMSSTGNVSLLFEDGQNNGSLTADIITVQNVTASQGNVTITAGSSTAVASNVVLTGQISSPAGSTTITTSAGNISSGGAGQLISAQSVTLTAKEGSIGAASPILIDLDPVQLNATAKGNINVTATGGPLIAGALESTAGNIVLTAGTATLGTDSLVLPATATLSAPKGTITLLAENDISAASGSTISSHGNVVIQGDYNNANPGRGTYLDILGIILAPLVTLSGSSSQNNVFTYFSSDATPGLIDTGSANDTVNIEGIGAATTVSGGSGKDTINVGSLSPARGGSLSPMGALLIVKGGSGTDSLNVDDSGSSANRTGTLTSSRDNRSGHDRRRRLHQHRRAQHLPGIRKRYPDHRGHRHGHDDRLCRYRHRHHRRAIDQRCDNASRWHR